MKQITCLMAIMVLIGCQTKPPTSSDTTSPSESINTKSPSVIVPAQLKEAFNIEDGVFLKEITTSSQLTMRVGEELMLIGSVQFTDGSSLSFDQARALIDFENKNPNLLNIDLNNRLVTALDSGQAKVYVRLKQNPTVQKEIILSIEKPLVAKDQALLNLEIE